MQRATPSGFGAVMLPPPRWPPQLTATPSTSARMRAPRRWALSRLSSSSTPGAGAGHEAAGGGAQRPRGALGLVVPALREHAHRVEARPDVVARRLDAAAQHALREAVADAQAALDHRLGPGAAGARVGGHLVAEGEDPGDARRDAARHHLLDGGAAEAAHLLRVDERDHLARRSCPCRRSRCRGSQPASQSTASSLARRPREAGVLPGLDARRAPRSGGTGSSRAAARRRRLFSASSSAPWGTPATWQAKPCSAIASLRRDARAPFAERVLEVRDAVRVRGDHAEARHDDAPPHRATPSPESVPEQTTLPSSSVIWPSMRSLRRRQNTLRDSMRTRVARAARCR